MKTYKVLVEHTSPKGNHSYGIVTCRAHNDSDARRTAYQLSGHTPLRTYEVQDNDPPYFNPFPDVKVG